MTARFAVFASGGGSNFQAVAEAINEGIIPGSIEVVVCDKPEAYVLERAEALGIDTFVFKPKDFPSREACEQAILEELRLREIDFIILAGYMRLVTPVLIEPFYGRMINIHPALLPSFPGLHGVRQALAYGVRITGVTVHFVDGGTDTGPIIAQQAVEVLPGDTEQTLSARIQKIEHELYPKVVRWLAEDRIRLDGRQVTITLQGV